MGTRDDRPRLPGLTPHSFSFVSQADTPAFRVVVSNSFILSYSFAFAVLAVLPLMPVQKADAQRRKAMWPRKPIYLYITLWAVGLAL